MRRTGFAALLAGALLAAPIAQAGVAISSKPTANMSCTGGVCTATARKAVLNAGDLAQMLSAGDVAVESGSLAQDIAVNAPLSWTSAHRLTLDAHRAVAVNRPAVVAGTGALTVAGALSFADKGHVEFWDIASGLAIDGKSFMLAANLKSLAAKIAANPSGSYALAKSYEASHDGNYEAAVVTTNFLGTFEGLGNTISNLAIVNDFVGSSIGMFAQTGAGSVLRDIRIQNETVTDLVCCNDYVGGLVVSGHSTITGVFVNATINAPHSSEAGIVAAIDANASLDHTSSSGSVYGNNGVGGIVADLYDSPISWSHSSAKVSADVAELGGVVGSMYSDIGALAIDHCYATGDVTQTGNGGSVGGLNVGTVTNSYATGTVKSGSYSYAGGLAGKPEGTQIFNTYATGAVSAGNSAFVGGLVGYKYNATEWSYSTGMVTGGTSTDIGGSVSLDASGGFENGDVYWDMDTSGITDPSQGAGNIVNDPGITGLSNATLAHGLPHGFDKSVWQQKKKINNGLPFLRDLPPQ